MESLTQGIPNVCVYMDDILVTGANLTDHLRNLDRFNKAGMRLKKEKCSFFDRSGVSRPSYFQAGAAAI